MGISWRRLPRLVLFASIIGGLFCNRYAPAQRKVEDKQAEDKKREPEAEPADAGKRVELNLVGKTDTAAGESRRNENIYFNPVDNNALKELNVRLGTTATVVREFLPSRNYFGAEFGNAPSALLAIPAAGGSGFHGRIFASHLNSIFSARSFFQVGDVKPAHENDYGFVLQAPLWKGSRLTFEGNQLKSRGSVNGNVLVPRPDERTPLATDPTTRAIVTRFLDAYPLELPNRTDINPRALNTNAPQSIDTNNGAVRLDQDLSAHDRLYLRYSFTSQDVDAFELVAGQNPITSNKFHTARIGWNREWSDSTLTSLSFGYDRLRSQLNPEENAVGPMVSTSGLETLGPQGNIPIDRAQNLFRYAGQITHLRGPHTLSAGFGLTRRQFNGVETDAHRGFFSFANDFGHDAITNLRLGLPSQFIVSIGNVHRGFRNWDMNFYVGDVWKAGSNLTLDFGLRYEPSPSPYEVNGLNVIPYDCDCNNFAPQFGLAYQLPGRWGVTRAGYGLQYGQIFPVTFQQVRFSPPGSVKIVVMAPDLSDPMRGLTQTGQIPDARPNLYLLDPELAVPYSHQYNLAWEPNWSQVLRFQFGYVGSRSHKLLVMWYLNRAHAVPGIPQTTATINDRRADPYHAEHRWVLNGSDGYFDAARASLVMPQWHGLSANASYWFSKAIDLGSNYTNTAYDNDSRVSRSQSEFETHRDMKGLSSFDQTHALLCAVNYQIPAAPGASWVRRLTSGWEISTVALAKTGMPFTVVSGSDAPGYGNVDGNGNDRVYLIDASVLGRTVGNPDTSRLMLPRTAFGFMQPTEESADLGHNTFRKGGIRNVNAMVSKTWGFGNDMKLTLRAESINLFNTPQFAEPGTELANGNFGQITNTLNDGRTFRFGAQFIW